MSVRIMRTISSSKAGSNVYKMFIKAESIIVANYALL